MCTGHTGFLIYREKAFYGTMLQVPVRQDKHLGSYADAVISPKGGATGPYPFTIYHRDYGVLAEVMWPALFLFAHHIHVALKDDSFPVFHTRTGRFGDQYITCFIFLCFKFMFVGKCQQVIYDLAFIPG